ncbi:MULTISPECIES: hypothetical protein [unclassified Streptomyces]|uniref:hypothetical protein n=1 Tax=unclassified Streptomyces TaxID=2593676 RepID=UPI00081E5939|nr:MULTISPECIES: hypothetical protein [unclassified Streptomyces]MYZ33981.1 hypothetical protein [Streptomyces sp. SID4917]SCF63204.1 hypothetical protein GA0115259_100397 [Streptomyces sp. MnatMP-M17]
MQNGITRRTVVKTTAVIGAATAVNSFVPGAASAAPKADPQGETKKLPTSANGWTIEKEANHVSTVWTRPVAGTGLKVDIRIGDVEAILVHVIRRFHYEVEQIQRIDLAGWRDIGGLRKGLPESNLASGTAVRIRPGASAKGGFYPAQELVLRDILADCGGLVRWGGDDSAVNESLFYIDAGPDDERVRKFADTLREWEVTPGAGAGVEVDVLSPSRRSRADSLARIQRSA